MSTVCEFETDINGYRTRPSAEDLRRAAKAPEPTPAEIEAAAAKHAAEYRAMQTALAAARFAEQTWHKLGDALEVCAERKEALASDHIAAAAPLQARLKSLEDSLINAIKNREAVAPEIETERSELLTKIQEMNATLKTAIEREDNIIKQLESERTTAARAAIVGQLEQELLALAPSPLRIELQVIRSSLKWAQVRLSAASESKRTEAFSAELAHAQSEVLRLQAAERKAFSDCLTA